MNNVSGTFRVTERSNETEELVRVIDNITDGILRDATRIEAESIPASGNYIRVEQWIENDEQDGGEWMYL